MTIFDKSKEETEFVVEKYTDRTNMSVCVFDVNGGIDKYYE